MTRDELLSRLERLEKRERTEAANQRSAARIRHESAEHARHPEKANYTKSIAEQYDDRAAFHEADAIALSEAIEAVRFVASLPDCPDCGPTKIDEDGCCTNCGCDAALPAPPTEEN